MNSPHQSSSATGTPATESRVSHTPGTANVQQDTSFSSPTDINWKIGQTFFLQHEAIRSPVKLIGFLDQKSLLVSAPVLDGKYQLVREGQVFVVRSFAGKRAYAFTSSVIKATHVPYPYLHLSYPKQVECTVVRRGARMDIRVVAAVSIGEGAQTAAIILQDISTGGAAGSMKEAIGVPGEGCRLKFKVRIAEEDIFLDLAAVLRSVQEDEGKPEVRHGFEFVDMGIRDKLVIGAFLHETKSQRD